MPIRRSREGRMKLSSYYLKLAGWLAIGVIIYSQLARIEGYDPNAIIALVCIATFAGAVGVAVWHSIRHHEQAFTPSVVLLIALCSSIAPVVRHVTVFAGAMLLVASFVIERLETGKPHGYAPPVAWSSVATLWCGMMAATLPFRLIPSSDPGDDIVHVVARIAIFVFAGLMIQALFREPQAKTA